MKRRSDVTACKKSPLNELVQLFIFWTSQPALPHLDIRPNLFVVLERLVDAGNTVLVIEHSLDVSDG